MSEREETENWWDYAYIKGGWAQFLFTPMAAIVIWSLMGIVPTLLVLGLRTFIFDTSWDGPLSYQIAIISAAVCVIAFTIKKRKEIRKFLTAYVDKNLGGYDRWCWTDGGKMMSQIVYHGAANLYDKIPTGCFVLILPMGGWHSQLGQMEFIDHNGTHRSPFVTGYPWQIKMCHRNRPEDMAFLIDNNGESMRMSVREILRFLQEPVTKFDWPNCVSQMIDNLENLRETHRSLEVRAHVTFTEKGALRDERDDLLFVVEEAIERIDDTQRFIKSDQGKKIRLWLITQLRKHLSPKDPRCLRYMLDDPASQNQPPTESPPPAEPAS